MRRYTFVILASLLSVALYAQPVVFVSPTSPTIFTAISIEARVLTGGCPHTGPTVQRADSTITVAIMTNPACLGSPGGFADIRADLGLLPAGTYTVRVHHNGNEVAQTTFTVTVEGTARELGEIRFDPPAPTSADAITALLSGTSGDACTPHAAVVSMQGRTITIHLTRQGGGCLTVPTQWSLRAAIGRLEAGIYEVLVTTDRTPPGTVGRKSLGVAEERPPFHVRPSIDSKAGGREITIEGTLPVGIPSVTFGGVAATSVVRVDDSRLKVIAPPHPAGAVDVTLAYPSGMVLTAIGAFRYYANETVDRDLFEPVLFPLLFSGPGAFGAQWTTETAIRNDNDFSPTFFPPPPIVCVGVPLPPCVVTPKSTHFVHPARPTGLLVYVERNASAGLSFVSHVRDLSRADRNFGTEIPVVRERDFRTVNRLLNIPMDSRFRHTLRVYSLEPDAGTVGAIDAVVRIYSNDGNTPRVVHTIRLRRQTVCVTGPCITGEPLFASVDNFAVSYPELAGLDRVRIEIESLGVPSIFAEPRPLWAFVSITNNETHQVTTVTPH